MNLRITTVIAMLTAVLGLLACQTTPPPPPPQQEPPPQTEFRDTAPVQRPVETPIPELKTVYFDFDRAEIRSDARVTLGTNSELIRNHSKLGRITLQGHCDERGSEEYNLALGERRARAVKRYLQDLGVPSSRIDTVSFGENKPAVMGHDESAWRWNRRVEFISER